MTPRASPRKHRTSVLPCGATTPRSDPIGWNSALWRYALVAIVVACCALFSAWSRIDLVEISVALDQSQADLKRAEADRARLELELATLKDPTHLSTASDELQLSDSVEVVPVPPLTPASSP